MAEGRESGFLSPLEEQFIQESEADGDIDQQLLRERELAAHRLWVSFQDSATAVSHLFRGMYGNLSTGIVMDKALGHNEVVVYGVGPPIGGFIVGLYDIGPREWCHMVFWAGVGSGSTWCWLMHCVRSAKQGPGTSETA